MAEKGYKKFIPSFLTILFELVEHWRRDAVHNNNIKKLNKTAEQLGTIENMLVRLEKKIQNSRDLVDRLRMYLFFSMTVNFVLLIVILLKVLGLF
jgi:hypothetical protein